MTPQQVIGLAVRLFAIWLATTSFQALGLAHAMENQPGAKTTGVPYALATLFLIVAVFLWLFPMAVAHKLVPRTQYENSLRVPSHEALVVACVVLGLWVMVAQAIPAIAYYISVVSIWVANGQPITSLEQSRHVNMIVGVIQLLVALILVFKAKIVTEYILPQHSKDKAA